MKNDTIQAQKIREIRDLLSISTPAIKPKKVKNVFDSSFPPLPELPTW